LRAVVLLSGGLDSAVALFWAQARGWEVFPIEFDYHQRPEREKKACSALRRYARIRESIIVPVPFLREISDLPDGALKNSVLSRAPEGYIPLRNLVFYSLAAYHAEILGARYLVGGHNRTDCESFPDAGEPFWQSLNRIFELAMWSYPDLKIEVILPLINLDKVGVIRLGRALGVPFDLTWSCYFDADQPCGACESCRERVSAFAAAAHLTDPDSGSS
jgi:7-cyano-7-deazaguanine synthase